MARGVALLALLLALLGPAGAARPLDEGTLSRSWVMKRKLVLDDGSGGAKVMEFEDCVVALGSNLACEMQDGSSGAWELRKGRKNGEGTVRIEVQDGTDKDGIILYEAELKPGKLSPQSTRWTNGKIYKSSLSLPFQKKQFVGEFTMHPQGLPPIVDMDCRRM
uniref:NADH:ubiquinone oxidoreductase intermediate-associated protein 30 domain-containing protein n=1 Tax=Phaeomonas parva TaxID=124430 RepID=A0A7S1TWR9_9STRA|mmetsp:Transcript_20762/g.63144  ORF Transcript_20762/g.63144 Transcript_20762/m.63144 type:complete len:163 (+) Transcript_20762:381-869(+)